jgi:hypothetical protein
MTTGDVDDWGGTDIVIRDNYFIHVDGDYSDSTAGFVTTAGLPGHVIYTAADGVVHVLPDHPPTIAERLNALREFLAQGFRDIETELLTH